MKLFKRLFALVLTLGFVGSAVACAGGADKGAGGYYGAMNGGYDVMGSMGEAMEDVEVGEVEKGEEVASGENDSVVEEIIQKPAGLITAGAWNDNTYYDDWKKLFDANEGPGKFSNYQGENSWGFSSYNRIKITVKNGETPIPGTRVTLLDSANEAVFTAVADANGVAYVFTDEAEGTLLVSCGEAVQTLEFTAENRDLVAEFNELSYPSPKLDVIELMFVVDVTGSMGDELNYLKNEIADVVNRVATSNGAAKINLALLFYRDHGDNEVFKYFDFEDVTNAAGLEKQQQALNEQFADGGGDWPEAVDEALELAVNKQWSTGVSTKIIFHVLDAPPHSGSSNQTKYREAVIKAAEKGIRLCPVLCSGADYLTEYLTRQAAIYTGGTFVFVTDDSGIGNAHHDPNIPNAVVEALNSLMVRLINGYHTGTFAPPVYWKEEVENVISSQYREQDKR